MMYAVFNVATGEILRTGQCSLAVFNLQAGFGEGIIELNEVIDAENYYVSDHTLIKKLDKPSNHHTFNFSTKVWDVDIVTLKEALKSRVTLERVRRNQLPITFRGQTFDADEKGQRNVQAWQIQLASGLPLPAGFVWRDADNASHSADAAFINGLSAAIVARGTALYQASWAHKDAIDALQDATALLAYDVTVGW